MHVITYKLYVSNIQELFLHPRKGSFKAHILSSYLATLASNSSVYLKPCHVVLLLFDSNYNMCILHFINIL